MSWAQGLYLKVLHGCIPPDDVGQSARSRPDVIRHPSKIDRIFGVVVDPHRKVAHLPQHQHHPLVTFLLVITQQYLLAGKAGSAASADHVL